MTREEMEGKFRGNGALAVSDERASRIVSDVTRLATLPRLTSLMEELR